MCNYTYSRTRTYGVPNTRTCTHIQAYISGRGLPIADCRCPCCEQQPGRLTCDVHVKAVAINAPEMAKLAKQKVTGTLGNAGEEKKVCSRAGLLIFLSWKIRFEEFKETATGANPVASYRIIPGV